MNSSTADRLADELRDAYPVLAGLPAASFDALLGQGRLLEVPAGTVVFDDHAACEAMPFLLEGTIRVSKVSQCGREILLYRVRAGEACVLTSSCLIGRVAHAARGVVERDARLLAVPEPVFRGLVAGDESFRAYVFALFSARLGELMALVEAVAFHRLDQRLAALLLAHGRILHVTHQSIADELGTVREIVTRLLHHFADDGIVRLSRERIEIVDPARLREIAAAAD